MKIIINEMLRELRAQKGISQEILAEKMGVTIQAVSKWETGISCPDISLLPELADYFGVSVDYLLLGSKNDAVTSLPDDNRLRIIQAMGNKILTKNDINKELTVMLIMPDADKQPDLTVEIWGNCSVEGDISGNLICKGNAECRNIGGDVNCDNGVNCGNVGGNISCGDGVNCGNVGAYVNCGDGVNCGNIGGNVNCGDSINCGNIDGSANCGDSITCSEISGNVESCGGDIHCSVIKGDASCEGNIIYK